MARPLLNTIESYRRQIMLHVLFTAGAAERVREKSGAAVHALRVEPLKLAEEIER